MVVTVAFAIALPVLFIAGNVRALATSKQTYDYNWWRNDAEGSTGLTRADLDSIGLQFRDYFNGDEDYLLLTREAGGQRQRLLTEQEVLHMRDVKELVRRVFAVEWMAAAIVVAYIAGGFATLKHGFWPLLRRSLFYATVGTAVAVAVIAFAAVVDFDTTFTIFHEISFTNDYWKLAYRDVLIQLWPQPFWFEATFAIVVMTALEFAAVTVGFTWFRRRFRGSATSRFQGRPTDTGRE